MLGAVCRRHTRRIGARVAASESFHSVRNVHRRGLLFRAHLVRKQGAGGSCMGGAAEPVSGKGSNKGSSFCTGGFPLAPGPDDGLGDALGLLLAAGADSSSFMADAEADQYHSTGCMSIISG